MSECPHGDKKYLCRICQNEKAREYYRRKWARLGSRLLPRTVTVIELDGYNITAKNVVLTATFAYDDHRSDGREIG